jgi:subtilase family protein/PKD domain-containing protein
MGGFWMFFLRRHRSAYASLIALTLFCALHASRFSYVAAQAPAADQPPIAVTTISVDDRGSARADGAPYHSSRVLVRFRNFVPHQFLAGSPSAIPFAADRNLYLVQNPPGLSVADVIARYAAQANVLYVEPDYVVHADSTPTDPGWSQQWDMVKVSAPTAWNTQTDSSTAVVAVVDTGIDFAHPDLQPNLWTNSDGSHGFTCIKGKCAKGGQDDFGHGTHVAGTIGAVGNNGIGIAGLNWSAQLLSMKFLDSSGNGYMSDAVLAFDQLTALKQAGVNIRVSNNSWGTDGFSQALKDAMARAEQAGILHVCAAGNNGRNADGAPIYPAAYDNRGLIAVLASDQNDAGATFTNYGVASVDIAAPGVSIFSTVPSGTCTLCDRSGYKVLSGTSMATPHVAAVTATLFHQNPALTVNEARDVVLDPRSYDALTDTKARSTSTGGRLNFAKALASPLLYAPLLNAFPTIEIGPNVFVPAGSTVTLSARGTDPDNDAIRLSWARAENTGLAGQWLFGWMLSKIFPTLTGSSPSFAAPSVGRTVTVAYDAAIADGRGGSDMGRQFVTVAPAGNVSAGPSGTLTVSPTSGPIGTTITVNFPVTVSKNSQMGWDLWLGAQSARGFCCFSGATTTVKLDSAGVYRIGTQAIDQTLKLSDRKTAVVRIGGASGEPPLANATFDKLTGPIPLTVNIDASASVDPDGSIRGYYVGCGNGTMTPWRKPQGSCTFTTPGSYWIEVMVRDNSGYLDVMSAYVVATP